MITSHYLHQRAPFWAWLWWPPYSHDALVLLPDARWLLYAMLWYALPKWLVHGRCSYNLGMLYPWMMTAAKVRLKEKSIDENWQVNEKQPAQKKNKEALTEAWNNCQSADGWLERPYASLMTKWLERMSHGMKCTVMVRRLWIQTLVRSTLGCVVLLSKSYSNQKYQSPVHQSFWEPVHYKLLQTSKIMWPYISFFQCVTDGWVFRMVSVTWNVPSWSEGHGLKPQSGQPWSAWCFCLSCT